ncbi:MAG: hypothetical protein EZS28_052014 [Streblomastix strix]|uniref:Uncharacterized protein n=1 Tax=Streblomastix strix TaxID=222440 RepID=A0A5J4SR96_9EUKA|nr:MAG: hypothetical protein EZS28_052014 [Streblomastix strix]
MFAVHSRPGHYGAITIAKVTSLLKYEISLDSIGIGGCTNKISLVHVLENASIRWACQSLMFAVTYRGSSLDVDDANRSRVNWMFQIILI